jgi:hypothetical protein
MLIIQALISCGWGILSPWLFLNGWLAFLALIAIILAFFQGRLGKKALIHKLFQAFSELSFYFILLIAGFYIIYSYYAMGKSDLEVIVYWLVATIQVCWLLTGISGRIDDLIEKSRQ